MKCFTLCSGLALVALAGCATPKPPVGMSVPMSDAVITHTTDLAPPPERLYVANQNDASVTVIDTRTNAVLRTVDLQKLGFSANAKPHHIQVEPDGSFWYVSLIGENRVVKMSHDDRVVASATFETPGMLTLDPDRHRLYVGRSMTAVNPPHRIGMVRTNDMSIEEVDVLFPRPHAMALQRKSQMVYTASLGVNQIAVVDAVSEAAKLINVAGPQHALMQFAVSPAGGTLAVSAELSGLLLVFDIGADPKAPKLLKTIEVGVQPFDPVFTLDSRWVYLGNKAANTVTVIDTRTWTVAKVIRGDGLSQPHGTAVSPDGRYVYVSNNNLKDPPMMPGMDHSQMAPPAPNAGGNGTVVVIDANTQAIVTVIPVGRNAAGLAVPTAR